MLLATIIETKKIAESIFCISHNITHKIRPGWKLVGVTRWKHKELVPG